MKNHELDKSDDTRVQQSEAKTETRRPYEKPQVVRRKSLVKATLFSGSGGAGAVTILP